MIGLGEEGRLVIICWEDSPTVPVMVCPEIYEKLDRVEGKVEYVDREGRVDGYIAEVLPVEVLDE